MEPRKQVRAAVKRIVHLFKAASRAGLRREFKAEREHLAGAAHYWRRLGAVAAGLEPLADKPAEREAARWLATLEPIAQRWHMPAPPDHILITR